MPEYHAASLGQYTRKRLPTEKLKLFPPRGGNDLGPADDLGRPLPPAGRPRPLPLPPAPPSLGVRRRLDPEPAALGILTRTCRSPRGISAGTLPLLFTSSGCASSYESKYFL
jgi:hypothetical protein